MGGGVRKERGGSMRDRGTRNDANLQVFAQCSVCANVPETFCACVCVSMFTLPSAQGIPDCMSEPVDQAKTTLLCPLFFDSLYPRLPINC